MCTLILLLVHRSIRSPLLFGTVRSWDKIAIQVSVGELDELDLSLRKKLSQRVPALLPGELPSVLIVSECCRVTDSSWC